MVSAARIARIGPVEGTSVLKVTVLVTAAAPTPPGAPVQPSAVHEFFCRVISPISPPASAACPACAQRELWWETLNRLVASNSVVLTAVNVTARISIAATRTEADSSERSLEYKKREAIPVF